MMDGFTTELFCYICDNATDFDTSGKLLCKVTNTSRASFPKVISTLISDEFVLIVGKEDVICEQCTDIVNRLDELQHEISLVRKILSEFLAKKYHVPINDPYDDLDKGVEDFEEKDQNEFFESRFCDVVQSNPNTQNEKNALIQDLQFKSGIEKKKLCWQDSEKNVDDYIVNCEPGSSVAKNSVIDDNASNNTVTDELGSEICFESLENSEVLGYSLDNKKINEDISAAYVVCELCNTLMKTASEMRNHVCQNQQLGNNNKKISFKETISVTDHNQNKNKDDSVVEVSVMSSLLERELTKPLKKDIKLNLCVKLNCFICDAILPSRSDLALHVLSHYPVKRSKKKGTVCPVCDSNYTSLIDFMNHYDMHVDGSGSKRKDKESAICNRKENNVTEKESTGESQSCEDISDKFTCPFCKKQNSNHLELNDHLKLKHNINTCHHCKKEFPSDLKLKEHLVLHEAKVKPNQCEYCLSRFNSAKELESHIESAHDQIKVTKSCPLCRKRCGSNFSVKSHVLKSHFIPVLQQEIREKYSHGSDLVDDMKSLGASEKFIKSIMDMHKPIVAENNPKNSKIIINVEASDVSFCLLCGFSSKSVPNLDRHREKHSAKKIQCPLCDYLSCDSDELTVHLSDSHDMLLSENCCPHCLSEPEEDIVLHMKALHGKFYTHLTCFVCKEMFFSKENLKYHFSITHLISEQRFGEKGDDMEIDDNSVEADDPLENGSRECTDDTMNNELTAALESIIPDSPQQVDPLEAVENSESLTSYQDHVSAALSLCDKLDNQEENELSLELPKGFICTICRKECMSAEELAVHTGKHSKKAKNTSCCFCSLVLYDNECLHQHVIKEHPQSIHKYCFPCKKPFNSKFALVKHLSSRSCNRVCVICNKQFKKIAPYIQHLTYSHRKDLKCSHCNKLCRNLKHLHYHEALHERYKGKVFKCDECEKTFLTPSSLKSHSISHTGNYQYVCEFCGRGFLSSYGLNEHRASHTGDIRYCCEICGKSFRLYDTYHRHRRQHDNPYPAECSECGIKFRNASRVAEHKRKVHTGERPYVCPYCPMAFNVTSSYHIHLCKHTKIYPYNCDICKRGFASRFKYANHLATRHNDYSFVTSKNETDNSD